METEQMFGEDVFAGTSETGHRDQRACWFLPVDRTWLTFNCSYTYDDSAPLEQVPCLTLFRRC